MRKIYNYSPVYPKFVAYVVLVGAPPTRPTASCEIASQVCAKVLHSSWFGLFESLPGRITPSAFPPDDLTKFSSQAS